MSELKMEKYPRTRHLEDSRLQDGDEGMGGTMFRDLPDDVLYVYEEKVDGANSGFRFDGAGNLYAQSRGHFLNMEDRNAPREDDWRLLKDWLRIHEGEFLERFEDRYIVYGEWCGITHSVYYDKLPHYFLEFDIFDLKNKCFLSTDARQELCHGLPIMSVPILYSGNKTDLRHLKSVAGPSCFQTPGILSDYGLGGDDLAWTENLRKSCNLVGDDYNERIKKMVSLPKMEGVYIKLERDGKTIDRYKWVNPDFTQTIKASNEHWQSRFPVPNLLGEQTDCFPCHLTSYNDGMTTQNEEYNCNHPQDWMTLEKPGFNIR